MRRNLTKPTNFKQPTSILIKKPQRKSKSEEILVPISPIKSSNFGTSASTLDVATNSTNSSSNLNYDLMDVSRSPVPASVPSLPSAPLSASVPAQSASSFDLEEQERRKKANAKVTKRMFLSVFFIVAFLGLISVVFCWVFIILSHGQLNTQSNILSWGSSSNLHKILMLTCFVYLHGWAVLIYRILPENPGPKVMLLHAGLHWAVITGVVIGGSSIWTYKASRHFQSLHGWSGIVAIIIYFSQFVVAFSVYLLPCVPKKIKLGLLPIHTVVGHVPFLLCSFTAGTGLMHRQTQTKHPFSDDQIALKLTSVFLSLYSTGIVILLTRERFRRIGAPTIDIPNKSDEEFQILP